MIIWAIYCIKHIISYNLTTLYILGQKFVKFFVGFLENLRHQEDILRLVDLFKVCTMSKGHNVQNLT